MIAVASGLVVLGGASYVHLAVAGHALTAERYSAMSVVWSIVFSIGIGLFMPIEQEITRIVAARRGKGGPAGRPVEGATEILRRGATLAVGLLAVIVILLAVFGRLIADKLFDGDVSLVWALGGAFAALACAHPTRGVLAGTGAFGWYGAQLGIDGGLRVVLAIGLGLAGAKSPLAFALILTVAPLLSVLVTLPAVLRLVRPGRNVGWGELTGGLGLLLVSSLLAQLVVNIGVVNVKILAPGDKALAGALLSAIVLARVPLFVFASLQASLLPGLSNAIAHGDRAAFRALLTRALGLVALLGLGGGIPAVILGPWLVPVLFGVARVLDRLDFLWFAAGTVAYMAALVYGQAVQALGRHRYQTLAWIIGTIALILITVGPGGVKVRVEVAYAIGSVVTALVMALATLLAKPSPNAVVADLAPVP
jgi:O-antigen/teichoic acid export membrane protein